MKRMKTKSNSGSVLFWLIVVAALIFFYFYFLGAFFGNYKLPPAFKKIASFFGIDPAFVQVGKERVRRLNDKAREDDRRAQELLNPPKNDNSQ
jgi:hypothetical protein